jgi:hypothetical protein
MPTVHSQLLDAIRDAYPATFEDLDPSKALGENVFGEPTPHPNAVLSLFVQQKLTSALPMAYYMAVRRGLDSLMDIEKLRSQVRDLEKEKRDIQRRYNEQVHCPAHIPTGSSLISL